MFYDSEEASISSARSHSREKLVLYIQMDLDFKYRTRMLYFVSMRLVAQNHLTLEFASPKVL